MTDLDAVDKAFIGFLSVAGTVVAVLIVIALVQLFGVIGIWFVPAAVAFFFIARAIYRALIRSDFL